MTFFLLIDFSGPQAPHYLNPALDYSFLFEINIKTLSVQTYT
jgi:hypothetical protein